MSPPTTQSDDTNGDREEWISGQYALATAFPHKTGNEQLAIIATLSHRRLLLTMLRQVIPADESVVEEHLIRVRDLGDTDTQARTLSFLYYSRSPFSRKSREILADLLTSKDRIVRSLAMGISARLRDRTLLTMIVNSGWDAAQLVEKDDFSERWHGSSALLRAAELELIDSATAIRRIAGDFLGDAIKRLPGLGPQAAIDRIGMALRSAIKLESIPEIPLIEQPVRTSPEQGPSLLSLVEENRPIDIRSFMERLNDTDETFQARQKRAWKSFDRFSKEITAAGAEIVLEDILWDSFDAIVSGHPSIAITWTSLLQQAKGRSFRSLYFFAVGLAKSVSKIDPVASTLLFKKLSGEKPLVRRVVGPSKIPAEALAIWSAADIPDIQTLAFHRLDHAENDSDIATEVLAAFSARKELLVAKYINHKLIRDIPSETARALMVAGFADHNSHTKKILDSFVKERGFIGRAASAASYAYERNAWSRHWYELMISTNRPEEFWRYATLLTKIVDGRYSLWCRAENDASLVFQRFFPTIKDRISHRVETWRGKRQNKLFGQDISRLALLDEK